MEYLNLFLRYYVFLIPLIMGIISFRYLDKGLMAIFGFVVFGTMVQYLGRILVLQGHYTIPMMHVYVPVKFILFSLAYGQALRGFINPRVIWLVAAIFVLFSAFNSLFIQGLDKFNNYIRAIGMLILAIYAILYFLKVLKEMKITRLRDEPMIWINTGILFYFTGGFFIIMLSNVLLAYSWELSAISWHTFRVIIAQFYLTAAIGFWLARRNKLAVNRQKYERSR